MTALEVCAAVPQEVGPDRVVAFPEDAIEDAGAAEPVVKWAGGKRRLLPQILPHLLTDDGKLRGDRYLEPCLGGGAVFFALAPRLAPGVAILGDILRPLMVAYRAVRDFPDGLIDELERLRDERAATGAVTHYYAVRDRFNAGIGDTLGQAACLLYLNRTCFNGLWRVRKNGAFNVPVGQYPDLDFFRDPGFCAARIRRASLVLRGQILAIEDLTASLGHAGPGDVFYVDPPYARSAGSEFVAYASGGFGASDQARLAMAAQSAVSRGARVVISNVDTPEIRGLYRGFSFYEIAAAPRSIAARATKRLPVRELIIVGDGT